MTSNPKVKIGMRFYRIIKWRIAGLVKDGQWLPEQTSGGLSLKGIRTYHETIYKIICNDECVTSRNQANHKMKYHLHKKPTKEIWKPDTSTELPLDYFLLFEK